MAYPAATLPCTACAEPVWLAHSEQHTQPSGCAIKPCNRCHSSPASGSHPPAPSAALIIQSAGVIHSAAERRKGMVARHFHRRQGCFGIQASTQLPSAVVACSEGAQMMLLLKERHPAWTQMHCCCSGSCVAACVAAVQGQGSSL